MADIKSTIRIEDGFTNTLVDLTKKAEESSRGLNQLKDSVIETSDTLNDSFNSTVNILLNQRREYFKGVRELITNHLNGIKKSIADKSSTKLLEQENVKLESILDTRAYFKKVSGDTIAFKAGMYAEEAAVRSNIRNIEAETDALKLASKAFPIYAREKLAAFGGAASTRIKNTAINGLANIIIFKKKFLNAMNFFRGQSSVKSLFKNIIGEVGAIGVAAKKSAKEFFELKKLKAQVAIEDVRLKAIDNKYLTRYSNAFHSETGGFKGSMKLIGEDLAHGMKNGFEKFRKSELGKAAGNIAKDFGKLFGAAMLQNLAFSLFDKLKDKFIEVFSSAREAISNSLEDLNISDKFSAMYGRKGEVANKRAYELANELGENSAMVSEMALRASNQGIGTKSFERMMHLADRIGKLQIGETTESAANSLLSNIKSGHDAGSLAQLLGGGQQMERKIRRSGFERALNRGDLNKALEIAEKITEQAGLTDEKYEAAQNSMSQNYKYIENTVNNIRHRLSEIYVKQLEPIVARIKEFLESKTFKVTMKVIEEGVKFIGGEVYKVMNWFLDNITTLATIFAVGMLAKTYVFIANLKGIIGLIGIIKNMTSSVLGFLGFKGIAGKLRTITSLQVKILAKQKAIAAVKILGPYVLAVAIAAAILVILDKCGVKVKGFFAAWYKLYTNLASFVFFLLLEAIPTMVQFVATKIQIVVTKLFGKLKPLALDYISFFFKVFEEMFTHSPLGFALKKTGVLDKLGFNADSMKESLRDNLNLVDDSGPKVLELEKKALELAEKGAGFKYRLSWEGIKDTITDGVSEALESNGASVTNWLKNMLSELKKQTKEEEGTNDNTGEIRRQGEQEEELRWLKAFSDRQIMQSYNSQTSNMSNVYFNGMSTAAVDAKARGFNPNRFPGRRKTA